MTTLPDWAYSVTPCVKDSPYASEVSDIIDASHQLGDSSAASQLKVLAVYNLCFTFRKLEQNPMEDPVPAFKEALTKNAAFLRAGASCLPPFLYDTAEKNFDSFEGVTTDHYGTLFSKFDEEKYFAEPSELLRQRLERNGFDIEWFKGKTALDSGCGNGRYTYALSNLGCENVHGLDLSEKNIQDAEYRLGVHPRSGIMYRLGTVLDLPYQDEEFDFVFSNGVLHHTPDCEKGVQECLRVLKKGGKGFFMVMPNPGGMHWDTIEICRSILHDMPHEVPHQIFEQLNIPANLRFLYLDHILVPINIRYTDQECRDMLSKAGAINITRLERGADVDGQEAMVTEGSYGDVLYGAGIHRYTFEK